MVQSVPRVWREQKYKYRLIGTKCEKCGSIFYPPKKICLKCGSEKMEEVKLPEEGILENYTIIYYPTRDFTYNPPIIVGLIRLTNGVRILAQVVDIDPSEVKEGLQLRAVFRRLREQGEDGVIEYGLKFRPKEE